MKLRRRGEMLSKEARFRVRSMLDCGIFVSTYRSVDSVSREYLFQYFSNFRSLLVWKVKNELFPKAVVGAEACEA